MKRARLPPKIVLFRYGFGYQGETTMIAEDATSSLRATLAAIAKNYEGYRTKNESSETTSSVVDKDDPTYALVVTHAPSLIASPISSHGTYKIQGSTGRGTLFDSPPCSTRSSVSSPTHGGVWSWTFLSPGAASLFGGLGNGPQISQSLMNPVGISARPATVMERRVRTSKRSCGACQISH